MALANVALTDTFDYWRTVTNSLVVAINDKLVYCNTSNANTVSIPSYASRTSNIYVNIITSTSLNDTATANVASAYTANTLQGLALVYASSANSNAQISVASANAWTNAVGASGNAWSNTKLSNTSGVSFAGSLAVPDTLTVSTNNVIDVNGARFRTGAGNYGLRIFPGGGTDSAASILQFTDSTQTQQLGWFVANGQYMALGSSGAAPLYLQTNSLNRVTIDSSGKMGVGTVTPAASLDVVGTVSIAKASVLNQTLTDGATINWDTSLGQVAYITLGGNRTMAAPSNLKVGTYILHVIQDGSGSRTITWNSVFKWPAGIAPVLSTPAGRRDLFSFVCDGTNLYGSYLPDVR
jgi:hypothetical protein